jgi:hypothetical protein
MRRSEGRKAPSPQGQLNWTLEDCYKMLDNYYQDPSVLGVSYEIAFYPDATLQSFSIDAQPVDNKNEKDIHNRFREC